MYVKGEYKQSFLYKYASALSANKYVLKVLLLCS